MPQSLASIHLHIVFSTKNRAPWLSKEVRPRAYAYIGGALRNIKCPATLIGGVEDHVHALVSMSRTVTVAKIVETMKSGSSRWMKDNGVTGFE
jgi:REP element-mobilizing transposase RayT